MAVALQAARQRSADLLAGSASALLDWFYPRHCCHCGELIEDRRGLVYCGPCFADLLARRIGGTVCAACGLPMPDPAAPGILCAGCADAQPHFELARAMLPYASPVAAAIRRFKFEGAFWLGPALLERLLGLGWLPAEVGGVDAVVPVPLHPRRRRERGYDQSLLLARTLARRIGRPCLAGALVRTRYTFQQSLLPRTGRLDNVRGAFAAPRREAVQGLSLMLVDDVITTGTTADECARTLARAGAAGVKVLALARALP